ncbi:MAG TPA: hypothetical protein VGD40_10130 [Chryseosolibacter sp.]
METTKDEQIKVQATTIETLNKTVALLERRLEECLVEADIKPTELQEDEKKCPRNRAELSEAIYDLFQDLAIVDIDFDREKERVSMDALNAEEYMRAFREDIARLGQDFLVAQNARKGGDLDFVAARPLTGVDEINMISTLDRLSDVFRRAENVYRSIRWHHGKHTS